VITRIVDYISSNRNLFQHRLPAYNQLIRGSVNPLVELTKNFFKNRPMMSLRTANEAVMQVTFEILLPMSFHVTELHLIVDGMKKSGDRCFGFVDLFVFESGDGPLISNVVLELKYITITGLLSGAQGFWIKNPDTKIMNLLDKDLENENEEHLLQCKYMYWSKEEKNL
ncbi:1022_t:CDS:1, partial [Entrophospora sp. SA101]